MPVLYRKLLILPLLALGAGCTSSSSFSHRLDNTSVQSIEVCHGHGCARRKQLVLGNAEARKLASLMAAGKGSAAAERLAISNAVKYFEARSTAAIGVRDGPKSSFTASSHRGQMDCVDESTNTRSLLLYLQSRGLLKHHVVDKNVSRGFFADGRYPHFTAVLRDEGGRKWVVDSWYEPAGGAPDIWPLAIWKTRGVGGERY